jgi:molybdenum cofactor synthesis domain-containing protein
MIPSMSTAGILIIGNEILTAKVQDENAPYLLRGLRELGIQVRRVHTIPDVIDEIADEVRCFSSRWRYVFTTGGVGPTHDDVTMDGVALAFGRKLALHPEMHHSLRHAMRGAELNESQRKMCMLPEGAQLITSRDMWFPLVQVENVFIFPGIPRLLQAKFESLRPRLEGRTVFLRRVFVTCMESDIAACLGEIVAEFRPLDVGSYPATSKLDYRTQVTLESHDEQVVARATDALLSRLPGDVLLRVE